MDFTRFKRIYSKIKLQRFRRIVVIVRVFFLLRSSPSAMYFFYLEPVGPLKESANFWVHRWAQTSGVRTVAGIQGVWFDGSVPSTWLSPEPEPWDLEPNEDPPDGLLMPPVPVVGDLGGPKEAKTSAPQLLPPRQGG
jgi:hypothetical protein